MGSLTDAYDRRVEDGGARGDDRGNDEERETVKPTSRERPYLGVGLLAVASALVGGGIVLATSVTAASLTGLEPVVVNELARVLCGVGLPLTFIGVLAVVETTRRLNALATIGFALTLCGVGAFFWAYPDRWLGDAFDLTIPVVALYAVGFALTFLSLVAGVLASGRRNAKESGADESTREPDGRTSLR